MRSQNRSGDDGLPERHMPEQLEGRLLIVGNDGGTNVGGSLFRAAQKLGLTAHLLEAHPAMQAPRWVQRFNWWLRGRRPTWLNRYSSSVVRKVAELRPQWLLVTGIMPINRAALVEIGRLGVRRMNFLTDDPWNPAHRAAWFLKTLPHYEHIFSPRRANLRDLQKQSGATVSYLPFGYDESLFFPEAVIENDERPQIYSDVIFAGGADRDRVPYFDALIKAGFKVALYGDYWNRYAETRASFRGYADPQTLRQAISGAKISLCLVRRANRDGHVMRTFELPAIGACMLIEDTAEHREIFGKDGAAVCYFSNPDEMIERARGS
jgi:hypothetical protein